MNLCLRRCLVGALAVVLCLEVAAQETAAPPDELVAMAPVVVDGTTLFEVRGISFYPAEKRAADVARAICQAAADREVDPDGVTLIPMGGRTEVSCGKHRIVDIVESEARQERLTLDNYSRVVQKQIADAIRRYRQDREPAVLRKRFLLATGMTAGAVLLFWLWLRLARHLNRVFSRRISGRVRDLQIQSVQLVRRRQIWHALQLLLKVSALLVGALLVYVFLYEVLRLFPWTRELSDTLLNHLLGPLRVILGGLLRAVPNLFFLAVLIFIVRYALRLVKAVFGSIESGRIKLSGFEPEWSWPTYRLTRLLMIALALVVAYPYIPGSSSEAFKAFSVFFGLLFSLGASSLVGNIIAGYSVTYRRAFRLGDRIKAGEHVGEVKDIRLMATCLRTLKNEEVVIPNSKLIGDEVLNYTSLARRHGLLLHTCVGIGYEVPWRKVEAMLIEAARATEGVDHARAFVLLKQLGDFSVVYELNVPCPAPARMEVLYSDLHRNILDAFNKYGVQIMTPAYEGDTPEPKLVPPERWFEAPAAAPVPAGKVDDTGGKAGGSGTDR